MTKSYYYIPTHFLYSSLLFFLLIFMYQLIHCHTLLQPFFKIFLFRIYVPTNTHTTQTIDPALDETSVRHPQIYAPIQPPQTNPPTTTDTQIPRQSSHHKPIHNDTVHQISTSTQPHKPIHQRPRPQIPRRPPQMHTAPAPTNTHTAPQTPTRRSPGPPTTLTTHSTPTHPTLSQHRHRHSTDAVTASARFVLLTGHNLTGRIPGRPHSSNLTGHTLTGRVPDRPLTPLSPRPAGRSPQIFPSKPDRVLIRDADAVVAGTRLLLSGLKPDI